MPLAVKACATRSPAEYNSAKLTGSSGVSPSYKKEVRAVRVGAKRGVEKHRAKFPPRHSLRRAARFGAPLQCACAVYFGKPLRIPQRHPRQPKLPNSTLPRWQQLHPRRYWLAQPRNPPAADETRIPAAPTTPPVQGCLSEIVLEVRFAPQSPHGVQVAEFFQHLARRYPAHVRAAIPGRVVGW